MHAGEDRPDFRCSAFAYDANCVTGFEFHFHLAPRYIGCAVKNINSFFYRDRLNAQSLLKEVRFKACRHASKNLVEFRLFSRVQHTNWLRFSAIDSRTNDQLFRFGLKFGPAVVAAFHALSSKSFTNEMQCSFPNRMPDSVIEIIPGFSKLRIS